MSAVIWNAGLWVNDGKMGEKESGRKERVLGGKNWMEILHETNVTLESQRNVDLLQGSDVISKINIEKNKEEV